VLQHQSFPDGYAIVNQGDLAESMYILAVGRAVATMTVEIGAPPKTLRSYQSGDYFGELALLSNQPRSATVSAQGPVTCFTIKRAHFETLSFSGRFLEVLRKGASRAQFANSSRDRPRLRRAATSAVLVPGSTSPSYAGRRNVSLGELKQLKQRRHGSQQNLASMLLSTSDDDALSSTSQGAQTSSVTSDLQKMQEQQVHMQNALDAANSSVAELREEVAKRFDRLEAALLGKQP
jgi:CRP-like cAMP-binding protein